jgi:peroxiredoxin
MPSLVKLYEGYKQSDFVVLAINLREEREIVNKYASNEKLPFPVLLDSTGKVAFDYGVRATPAHYLINKKGELAAMIMGARDWTSAESHNFVRFFIDQKQSS